jgi:hypothetical protein
MARTTLDIDASVLHELRQRAEMEDKSMGAMASELLAGALATRPTRRLEPLRWTSHELGVPRASLGDKEAMGALMDRAPDQPGADR